ncbi:membrane protein insertase YidC [Rubritalea marina]|uniref:membrane protein insertase YidC n=1 Tax=Rubritalea marina TaxID=361055 RepID=UPI0003658D35|nr:membrane protein insertase YidC [Rubritalea marina]
MDRKAWIILVLCSLGLVANYYYMSETQKELEVQQRVEETAQKTVEAEALKDGLVTQKPTIESGEKDQPHTLVGMDGEIEDVIYTFTNFGGGVKSAAFPQQQTIYGEGHVEVNVHSPFAVGALADDYQKIDNSYYEIVAKDDKSITYRGQVAPGVEVTKSWKLVEKAEAKGYQLHLDVTFKNASASVINVSDYGLYTGTVAPLHGKEMQDKAGWFYFEDSSFSFKQHKPFSGGWFSDAKAVEIIKPSSLEYAGVNNQFFTTFIMPKGFQADSLWATGREREIQEDEEMMKRWVFTMGVNFPDQVVNAGSEQSYSVDIYMGPKKRELIKQVAPHTDSIMNYGWFSVFATFMSWALNMIHGWFGDASWAWGVSVILLTVFIRIIIWPLHNKSTRTMKRMGKLQPIMKEMREKYADNPQKLNQETMKMYRQYGVNPMGGCLPMLIQIPIFFGVFKMLGSAVEMRGASFLWVEDLSRPDTVFEVMGVPINVLPIVMAITMVLQMRLTPQAGDKLQQRIFMMMPLMFFFFCYNYAAALALYWSTQNVVSIGQTLLMKKLPEPELKESGKSSNDDSAKPRKKGLFEKFAERLEDVQRQQEIAAGKKPGGNAPQNPMAPGQMKQAKKPKKRDPKTGG